MPFSKREIEPVAVTRFGVSGRATNMPDELQYTANTTLANLIRQLSHLSLQTHDIFRELYEEVCSMQQRFNHLTARQQRLHVRCGALNAEKDEIKFDLRDLNESFVSVQDCQRHLLSRLTLPQSLFQRYTMCAPLPALTQFDELRADNRRSMQFYSDPDFFFKLSSQSALLDNDHFQQVSSKIDGRGALDEFERVIQSKSASFVNLELNEMDESKRIDELLDSYRKLRISPALPLEISNRYIRPHKFPPLTNVSFQQKKEGEVSPLSSLAPFTLDQISPPCMFNDMLETRGIDVLQQSFSDTPGDIPSPPPPLPHCEFSFRYELNTRDTFPSPPKEMENCDSWLTVQWQDAQVNNVTLKDADESLCDSCTLKPAKKAYQNGVTGKENNEAEEIGKWISDAG